MGKTMKHVDILLNAKLQEAGFDLTKKQVLLMRFISVGVHAQSELCVITERDKSSLTRLIQSLERKNLVVRTAHEKDKRQQLVSLTEEGHLLLNKAMPIMFSAFEIMEAGINKEELEVTKRVLKQLLANTELEINHLNK